VRVESFTVREQFLCTTVRNDHEIALKTVLKPADFEAKWASLATAEIWGTSLIAAPGAGELEKLLLPAHIVCTASGNVGGVTKYYFYGLDDASEGGCVAEVSITLASSRLSAVVKAATPSVGAGFVEVFNAAKASLVAA
jgi:hypothetical protein